jgi:hypothetical protein
MLSGTARLEGLVKEPGEQIDAEGLDQARSRAIATQMRRSMSGCEQLGVYAVKGIKLVVDAVNIVVTNLAQLPDGPDVRKLREKAAACLALAEGGRSPPLVDQCEALMKKVLGLERFVRTIKYECLRELLQSRIRPSRRSGRGLLLRIIPSPAVRVS